MAGGEESRGQGGLVDCQLTLAATASRPGETVTALLQVSCTQPEAVELQEVEIEFSGIERVDSSWVLPTYRRNATPINTDKRKVQRYVVQSRLQAATQGTFSDLSLRRFVVRFTLPSWLPPTFRGTAVRYVYFLQAAVKFRAAQPDQAAAVEAAAMAAAAAEAAAVANGGSIGDSGGSGPQLAASTSLGAADAAAVAAVAAAVEAGSGSVTSRVPLHIWPTKQQQQQPDGQSADWSASLLSSSAAAASGANGKALWPPGPVSEEMPVKCWEIGPGTAVQDAVAHIVKMAVQSPQPSRPRSPGQPVRSIHGGGGGGAAGSRAARSLSEISHEPSVADEAEAQQEELSAHVSPFDQPAQQQQQQAAAAAPPGSQPGAAASSSGSSTPQPGRRQSLARPSLDVGATALQRTASQLLVDSGSTLRSYALRIGDQPLVRVSLHPPLEGTLQPGATLAGTLDFTQQLAAVTTAAAAAAQDGSAGGAAVAVGPSPRCMQVLILLETEEIVEQPWRRQVKGGGSGAIRRVYDEHLEVTADTACTHFLFTIPPDAAASFQTPLLQLRWLLRFQFTASMPTAAAGGGGGAAGRLGGKAGAAADWNPLQGRLEQLSWALPVTVQSPTS